MDRLFVANVERLRAEQGLSRSALARKAGMSVDTLKAWSNKNVSPTLRMIPAVADALGVTPVDLLTEPAKKKKRERRRQENGQ
jgi:transcriptional regulator with XRE-family HTH domain